MQVRAAKLLASQFLGQIFTDYPSEESFNAEKRDHHVGEADQQDGPEKCPNQESIGIRDHCTVCTQRLGASGLDVDDHRCETSNVGSGLDPGQSSRFSRLKDWGNAGPVLCHRQVIIDEKDSQDGEHGPAEYTDPEGSHVANTCSCFLGCSHDAKRKEGAGLTPRPKRIMLLRNQLSNSKNLVS